MTVEQSVQTRLYRLGDAGPVVKEIQLALSRFGYPLKGTGYFGGATDAAVSAFQRRAGIEADGVVGPVTARALDQARDITPHVPEEVTRPLWVTYGISTIGTKERPGSGDNRVIIDWARDEGGDIAAAYTHDSIPWCALWANHILTKTGFKGTETLWALDFANVRKWPCTKLAGPAVGAFAPMKRDGGGHITVVIGKDQHGNVMGLGGNQSDEVNITPFATSRLNQGFYWPMGAPIDLATVGFNKLPIVKSNGQLSTQEG